MKRFHLATCLMALTLPALADEQVHYDKEQYRTIEDSALARIMAARDKDWRMGAVVYQVIVDRFAPSDRLGEKRALYKAPRRLMNWQDLPEPGHPVESVGNWSHELEFWGGDMASLTAKLDYIDGLGADILYLNPIHEAFTNHKYDASDYNRVSPEYGTREDVKTLAMSLHTRGMHLVLDGVFNHMGKRAPIFEAAKADPQSPYRDWFFFGDAYKGGYRSWIDSGSLPELRLENPAVQDYIYRSESSVVRSYLRDGVDGWRLDVAFDVGPVALQGISDAAHTEKPGSLVVGEIWSYPDGWFPALDGVMNFPFRRMILSMLEGKLSGAQAVRMMDRAVSDAGTEPMLRSWLVLDNHDTKRLKTMLPEVWQQTMARTLQFTLPGSPNLYYGAELGMEGDDDPRNRAPMRWDMVTNDNATLAKTRALIKLHKSHRALRIGNFRTLESTNLLAFERYTDQALETVIVVANPSDQPVNETLMVGNWKIMNGSPLVDAVTGERISEVRSSLFDITLAAHEVRILMPAEFENDWSPYERVP